MSFFNLFYFKRTLFTKFLLFFGQKWQERPQKRGLKGKHLDYKVFFVCLFVLENHFPLQDISQQKHGLEVLLQRILGYP